MAIFLGGGSAGPPWPNPVQPSPMFPHFGARNGDYYKMYYPGFSDDAATGMCIRVTWSGDTITAVAYLDKAASVQWTKGPGDISSGADKIVSLFMDDNDAQLYFLVVDEGTSPDQWALAHANKAGTVVRISWDEAGSGTSLDYSDSKVGSFYRTGGDGVGDFVFLHGKGVLGAAAGAPYRGAKMTFAVSNGALTEAHILPDTAGGLAYGIQGPDFGPTSNNIIGGVQYNRNDKGLYIATGPLFNTSTGNGLDWVAYPVNMGSPFGQGHSSQYMASTFRWREHYAIGQPYTSAGGFFFTEDSIHNMLDEMAVQHGIL